LKNIVGRQQQMVFQNRNSVSWKDNFETACEANIAANEYQTFELLNPRAVVESVIKGGSPDAEGPSLSYPLTASVSLASRSDQQMVRIARTKLQSRFYHVATPVLTSFVYREAELTNTSPQDLLGGQVNAYLDGRFVGRGEIDTVARGQTFVVGFGADPQLKARREQADKDEKIQGGNRVISANFRLVLENFKDSAVSVRLFDRLPYAENTDALRVTLGQMSDKLSDDATYLRIERPKGILRWAIDVPAGAASEKAKLVSYGYVLEHDRNLQITTPGTEQAGRFREQFEQLEKQRAAK
jgi:uncharacterized protein (TIGR02231 family)